VIALIFVILYLTYKDLADAALMMLAVPVALAGGAFFMYLFPKIVGGWDTPPMDFSVAVWVGFHRLFRHGHRNRNHSCGLSAEAIDKRSGLENIQGHLFGGGSWQHASAETHAATAKKGRRLPSPKPRMSRRCDGVSSRTSPQTAMFSRANAATFLVARSGVNRLVAASHRPGSIDPRQVDGGGASSPRRSRTRPPTRVGQERFDGIARGYTASRPGRASSE